MLSNPEDFLTLPAVVAAADELVETVAAWPRNLRLQLATSQVS